jgi:hypothetical protein
VITRTQRTALVASAVAAVVLAANASHSAYFSQSWGWVALAFLVPATVLVILGRVAVPGRLRVAFASLLGALGAWIALSTIWSLSVPASAREVERMLVYVALALALALVLRRGDGPAVAGGAFVGVVAVAAWGLATRLFPDRFDSFDDAFNTYRLAEPLGYWNATGLLAAMGVLLGLGLAAHARRAALAVLAAAALPVLASTLYFTFSRGAWAALIVGFVASAAVDPRRLQFVWMSLLSSIPAVVCVAYGSQLEALTTEDALPAAAVREGERMALVVAAAVPAAALAAAFGRAVSGRIEPGPRARRGFDAALAGAGAVAAAAFLVALGGPRAAWSEVEQRFSADPVAAADLNERLFSISGNGRSQLLRVAWDAGLERPIVGSGSGTFEYVWYERRPTQLIVRDAHSLYLETFAEAGIVGVTLLVGALLVPLVAASRARRSRLVAPAAGAYVAWLAASTFDWHWEMVGVTATALLAASVGLVSAERRTGGLLGEGSRLALVGVTGTLSVLAVWSLVGNQALFAGREAVARKEWGEAHDHARRARGLLFWSHEPVIVLGDAEAGLGDREGTVAAYRDAVEKNPRSWAAWLRLAQVLRGAERNAAYDRVHQLNPREEGLPGE